MKDQDSTAKPLKTLSQYDHPYYCSDSNYYSNDAAVKFDTFADFYEEFHDADIDMNLIFRWDVQEREESKRCYCEVFMMNQRKGIFRPIHINYFDATDEALAIPFFHKHWAYLVKLWDPISSLPALNGSDSEPPNSHSIPLPNTGDK